MKLQPVSTSTESERRSIKNPCRVSKRIQTQQGAGYDSQLSARNSQGWPLEPPPGEYERPPRCREGGVFDGPPLYVAPYAVYVVKTMIKHGSDLRKQHKELNLLSP